MSIEKVDVWSVLPDLFELFLFYALCFLHHALVLFGLQFASLSHRQLDRSLEIDLLVRVQEPVQAI